MARPSGNSCRDGAEVSRSHSRHGRCPPSDWTAGNKPGVTDSREALPRRRAERRRGGAPMSFHDMMNPTGGVPMERVIDQPTPEQHLLERILSSENMEQAWKRVKANKGAPGIDGITIEQFPDHTRYSLARPSANRCMTGTLPTLAGHTGRDSESNGRKPSAGNPHRPRPADPTVHCPGADADLRSGILGIEFRFPTRTVSP